MWGGQSTPPYTANAVDYDGITNYLTRGAGLTGAVDGSQGVFYGYVRFDGGDSAMQDIFINFDGRVIIYKDTNNKIAFQVTNSTDTNTLIVVSSNSYTSSATWHSILCSWDTNLSAGNKLRSLYIDDVSDIGSVTDAQAAFNVDYTSSNWSVGAYTNGTNKVNGCMAETYLCSTSYLDFSITGNRRKFISSTNKPVNILTSGAPSGIVYMKNPALSIGTNSGSGGNFTANGLFLNCSSSPSN